MTKHIVTYIGDVSNQRSGPDEVSFRGVTFERNEAVPLSVESKDGEAMIAKLRGNRFFKIEEPDSSDEPEKPKVKGKGKKADDAGSGE